MSFANTIMAPEVKNVWVPLGAVLAALVAIGGATVTWASDRKDLNRNVESRIDHESRLKTLETAVIESVYERRELTKELVRVRQELEKFNRRQAP